ncbi:MAG: hypothetical protein AAGK37_22210 [Pseudomonadota bacterium]
MIWRDVRPATGLGVSQIIGYGSLMYAYAILLPVMAQDLGLTLAEVFGILSPGLFFGGLIAPLAGKLVDQFGGRPVMVFGAALGGLALIALGFVEGRTGLFAAILLAEAAAMFVLYNVAFASIAQLDLGVASPRRSSGH